MEKNPDIQFRSPEEIKLYQEARLTETLAYLQAHSRFYLFDPGGVYGMFFEHLLIEAGMCLQVSLGFSESGFLIQFNLFRRTKQRS